MFFIFFKVIIWVQKDYKPWSVIELPLKFTFKWIKFWKFMKVDPNFYKPSNPNLFPLLFIFLYLLKMNFQIEKKGLMQ